MRTNCRRYPHPEREAGFIWIRRLIAGTALLACGTTLADTATNADAWREQMTSVLELMQRDARKARASAGLASLSPTLPATPVPAPARDRLRLAALYGSAGKLTAVVYVNGVRKEYRPGASLPYAGAGAGKEYRLERIMDSCVVLRKPASGARRSVCYEPLMPSGVSTPTREPAWAPPPIASAAALDTPLPGFPVQ